MRSLRSAPSHRALRRAAETAVCFAAALLVVSLLVPAAGAQASPDADASTAPAESQPDGRPDPEAPGTEIQVLVDARTPGGRLPTALTAANFLVREDGNLVEVVDAEPLSHARAGRDSFRRSQSAISDHPWQILIYFDVPLLSESGLSRLAEALGSASEELTALGTVEVVLASPEPRIWLGPSRDPKLVRSTLERVRHADLAPTTLASLRQRYLDGGTIERFLHTDPATWDLASVRRDVRDAAEAEIGLVDARLETLRWWLLSYDAAALPKGLVWVGEGLDLDPTPFYLAGLTEEGLRLELEEDLLLLRPAYSASETARLVGALGWTMLPLWHRSLQQEVAPPAGGRRAVDVSRSSFLLDPETALGQFAEASGGQVATEVDFASRLLPRLDERWILTYRAERPPDELLHRVEITSPRLVVRAAAWRSTPSGPTGLARALRAGAPGGLDTTCTREEGDTAGAGGELLEARPFRLACDVRFGPELQRTFAAGGAASASRPASAARDATLQLTVIAQGGGAGRERFDVAVPTLLDDAKLATGVRIAAELPARLRERELVVVLTEERSGRWAMDRVPPGQGASWNPFPTSSGFATQGAADTKPIYLSPFDRPMVAGSVLVEAQVTRPEVARVDFLLDGLRFASEDERPYEAWLRLGSLPEPHTLEAVAVGASGGELGRDRMLINQGLGHHRVHIKEPSSLEGGGDYDVEIEVDAPPSAPASGVELYWNERLLETFEHPPYRTRIHLPAIFEGDYLRAVATFPDGETSEDTLLRARSGFALETEVELIELYTVAKDERGRPLTDLLPSEVTLLDEGEPQKIRSFEKASNVPLSLSLTIDISESMRERMPTVKAAAQDFVDALLGPEDRVVLTAFNHRPFLIQGPTRDPDLLSHDIDRLPSVGGTALFDAIIYSLLQLRALEGRKAVVLLTDGKDKHSRFTYNNALQFARKSAIPVYLITLTDPSQGLDPEQEGILQRLAELTGGALHTIHSATQLSRIYDRIAEELRNQVVITFQSNYESSSTNWRRLELRIARPGARAQTISGYFPTRGR